MKDQRRAHADRPRNPVDSGRLPPSDSWASFIDYSIFFCWAAAGPWAAGGVRWLRQRKANVFGSGSVVAVVVVIVGGGVALARMVVRIVHRSQQDRQGRQGDVARSVVATGKIQPITKVEVKSKASGIVEKLFVDINNKVRKGAAPGRARSAGNPGPGGGAKGAAGGGRRPMSAPTRPTSSRTR